MTKHGNLLLAIIGLFVLVVIVNAWIMPALASVLRLVPGLGY